MQIIIKKSADNKCWRGCGEKGILNWYSYCEEQYGGSLKKLKLELPYDPAISCLGIYPKKTVLRQHTCTPVIIADLFTIAETWKQPKCPTTDDKEDVVCICVCIYIHTHKGMSLSHKKE